MKVINGNDISYFEVNLDDGNKFVVWVSTDSIVISVPASKHILLTPIMGNAVKIESEEE